MRLSLTLLLAMLLGFAPAALAQDTGRVAGKVLDHTGAPLPGVAIDLVIDTREWTTTSDGEGDYRFDGLPPGPAELTYRLLNFNILRRNVRLANGGSVAADVVLTLSFSADVIVTGRATFRSLADAENPAEDLVGIASAASQGAITADQLEARPAMRAGEVLETVPGMIVSQHSGEGKANQSYLRGFNLDHGTDFATTVAGVPVNMPTGAHSHGYADANFLIPELVSGVQFKKGPYFADEGDFSAAGAVNVNYVNQVDRPFVRVGGGNDGWGRIVGVASPTVAKWPSARGPRAQSRRRAVGAARRLSSRQRRSAIQSRRQPQRLLGDRHGLLGELACHRSGGLLAPSPAN